MSGRFAIKTSVPVEKSRAEIEVLLAKYGAEGFLYGWANSLAQIEFVVHSRLVRFTLRLPDPHLDRFRLTPGRRKRRDQNQSYAAWEQECRSLWRALRLAIQAKLESVEVGISEFEQEFFAFIVDPISNRTVYEAVRPALAQRYEGRDTPLLGLPAPNEV